MPELDRLLDTVTEERAAADRLGRAFEQALFTAQSRVQAVSDYIDTRRGSIGPEARTRLTRRCASWRAAQAKRSSNLPEAIQHANGAAMLAGQAQSMANSDVVASQRAYTGRYGSGGGNNMGAVLGGIIIGNILSGGLGGGIGGGRRIRRRRRVDVDDVRRVRRRLQRRRRTVLGFPAGVRGLQIRTGRLVVAAWRDPVLPLLFAHVGGQLLAQLLRPRGGVPATFWSARDHRSSRIPSRRWCARRHRRTHH